MVLTASCGEGNMHTYIYPLVNLKDKMSNMFQIQAVISLTLYLNAVTKKQKKLCANWSKKRSYHLPSWNGSWDELLIKS